MKPSKNLKDRLHVNWSVECDAVRIHMEVLMLHAVQYRIVALTFLRLLLFACFPLRLCYPGSNDVGNASSKAGLFRVS